jgi:hypothetical protein
LKDGSRWHKLVQTLEDAGRRERLSNFVVVTFWELGWLPLQKLDLVKSCSANPRQMAPHKEAQM